MVEALKQKVYEANMALPAAGLVLYTWGNVSGIDRESGLMAIKPSGVEYSELRPEDMVVVDLNGKVVEGSLKPSSDADTHIEMYKAFPKIGGVVHTHSTWATIFAQAGRCVPALGTTHADYFYGQVPCTRPLTPEEIAADYEKNTGLAIAQTFGAGPLAKDPERCPRYEEVPAVLVREHGPFTWGKDPAEAVYHAVVLEQVAQMAFYTQSLQIAAGESPAPMQQALLDRHFLRKHGKNAYYGQKKH